MIKTMRELIDALKTLVEVEDAMVDFDNHTITIIDTDGMSEDGDFEERNFIREDLIDAVLEFANSCGEIFSNGYVIKFKGWYLDFLSFGI